MNAAAVRELAAEVKAAGLSRAEFEGVVYRLSGQQRRLYLRLCRGAADTVELRSGCSIGNVSEVVRAINAKLTAAGDPRRVICEVRPHVNQFGESGSLGVWKLARPRAAAHAA